MAHTSSVKVEGPVMSLDLNKDNNKVAAAGRRAFKIFLLDESNNFVEEVDLRGTDTINLNYSFNDVVWNWREEHILATAATNGAIVLWNLNKVHTKQERILVDHKRTVNRVNFHSSDPLLISGSQDGTIRCFDLRTKEPGKIFNSKTDSIRDVKWSPHSTTCFAAVSENGSVQLWDTRRLDKCYTQYAAHSEPVFSCDWHPEFSWLATSSRDKSIKVWDVVPSKPLLKHVIHTISSVGRVKWRPCHKYHIASTALVVDRNINIWDIRRPYIPYACFTGHHDIATDIKWKSDPQFLLSAGRDCYIIHHMFLDSIRPADSINPQAMSVNSRGDILHTQRTVNVAVSSHKTAGSKIQGLLRRTIQVNDTFDQASSQLQLFASFNSTIADDDAKFFIECAIHYMFHGKPLNEICEHNASVANQLGHYDVGFIWEVVKQIFTSNYFDLEEQFSKEEINNNCVNNEIYKSEDSYKTDELDGIDDFDHSIGVSVNNGIIQSQGGKVFEDGRISDSIDKREKGHVEHIENNNDVVIDGDDTETYNGNGDVDGYGGEETEIESITEVQISLDNSDLVNQEPNRCAGKRLQSDDLTNEPCISVGDFLFGDRDMDPFSLDYDNCENLCFSSGVFADKFDIDDYDWNIPVEAFAPRHEIKEGPLPPELLPTNIAPTISKFDRALSQVKFVKSDSGPFELMVRRKSKIPFWNSSELVASALHHHANCGDFQTAVAVLLVLGDRRRFLTRRAALDEMIQEQWLLAYIDMLNRYKLWNITTKVIQHSWISSVYQLNQHSTTMRTCCGKCHRPMVRCGWICDRCHTRAPSVCSLCHEVVKGLFAWCQGCAHGGHLAHIKSWFRISKLCPAGCGHICEY